MASSVPNQGQPQGQSGQQGQLLGGGQGVPKSQQGTGYTNLNTIMNANQGNQLGQAVAGGIENTGQQTTQALQQGQQQFQQGVGANTLDTTANQQNVQSVLGGLGVGANGQSYQAPTSVTGPTAAQVSQFGQYEAGQYGGPTNIANIGNIQNQAANAQQQGQETSSAGGRQSLLQQYAANPGTSYGQGAQTLDTALLGATGGNQLAQARGAVSGLSNQVNQAQSAAQQQATQVANQNAGFGQSVTGQVQNAANQNLTAANQTAQQYNNANTAAQNAEQAQAQAAQNGQLTPQALAALGFNNGDRTYGVNVGQYIGFTPANEQATALNVMGNPQYQQYSGLNQLMGQATGPQGPAYQAGQTTYNQAGLQAAIAAAGAPLTAAQGQVSFYQNALNQAQADAAHNPWAGAAVQGDTTNLQNAQNQYNLLNNQLTGRVSDS